jgi:hypothetical protein
MEFSSVAALEIVAKIGLVVFGLSLAYAWRFLALEGVLGK